MFAVYVLLFVLAVGYGIGLYLAPRAGDRSVARGLRDAAAPFAACLKATGLSVRLRPLLYRHRLALAVLEGGECSSERLLRWTAEAAGLGYAAAFAGLALAAAAGQPLIGWIGTAAGMCVPALRSRELARRLEERKHAFAREMPVMLSRLLVLVQAGEPVVRALGRCVEGSEGAEGGEHPLYAELRAALTAMERGEGMQLALGEFARRCAVPEAKLLAATLLMNARRGGEALTPALADLTRQLWDKRKAAARTRGEQASSRLAFPLAAVFFVIVALVGAPAVLTMG